MSVSNAAARLAQSRKVLEKRAAIAKFQESLKSTKVKIITAKAELASLRGKRK